MNRFAILEPLTQQEAPTEWTIYPTGAGAFACGNPDGRELRDGQTVAILLSGRWITGFVESRPHTPSRFIALDDHSVCGLCPGMRIQLLHWMEG